MRIHWFSPLTPSRTDIAHFTLRLLPFLSARAEVILWTDQPRWYSSLQRYAEVRRFDAEKLRGGVGERSPAIFYNMGNDARFHRGIWETARRFPGFVIMHDVFMHDSIAFHYRKQNDRGAYLDLMQSLYGSRGRRDAGMHWDNVLSMHQMGRRYACSRFILESSLGAIIHSHAAERALRREVDLPIVRLPLPFPARRNPAAHTGPPPWRLVLFGYLGSNRCLEEVLMALAALENRDRFHLHIYGQIHDQEGCRRLIERFRLENSVTVHGFVHEVELEEALASAHLAINLRFPTKGEASGSQLRIWSHGLPGVVTRTGWYAELPEDTVAFVRPQSMVDDLCTHLNAYASNAEPYRELGRKGYEYFVERHSPERYAAAIVNLAGKAREYRNRLNASLMNDRARRALAGFGGAAPFRNRAALAVGGLSNVSRSGSVA